MATTCWFYSEDHGIHAVSRMEMDHHHCHDDLYDHWLDDPGHPPWPERLLRVKTTGWMAIERAATFLPMGSAGRLRVCYPGGSYCESNRLLITGVRAEADAILYELQDEESLRREGWVFFDFIEEPHRPVPVEPAPVGEPLELDALRVLLGGSPGEDGGIRFSSEGGFRLRPGRN